MKLDTALSNGRPCTSAEWLNELSQWEHENDDCLPLVPIAFTSPPPVRPPPSRDICALDKGQSVGELAEI